MSSGTASRERCQVTGTPLPGTSLESPATCCSSAGSGSPQARVRAWMPRSVGDTSTMSTWTAAEKLAKAAVPLSRSAMSVPRPGPISTIRTRSGLPSCIQVLTAQIPTICRAIVKIVVDILQPAS